MLTLTHARTHAHIVVTRTNGHVFGGKFVTDFPPARPTGQWLFTVSRYVCVYLCDQLRITMLNCT